MREGRALSLVFWTAAGLAWVLPGLLGCSMLNGFLDPTKLGQFPSEYQERGVRRILTPRDAPFGPANATEPTEEDLIPLYEEYALAPGDVLGIEIQDFLVMGAPYQAVLEISPLGSIRLPHLGSIRVVGMTEQELEEELKARLREAKILPEPDVRVYAQVRRHRTVVVRGAVGRPGQYPIPEPDTRLLDVIGMVADIAATVPRFYVIRRTEPTRVPPSTEPVPQQPGGEGLIVPPPTEEDPPELHLSASAGLGQAPPESPPPTQPTDELAEVMAPSPAVATQEAEPRGQPRFEPLVFDPQTGKLLPKESGPPVAQEQAAPAEPLPPLAEEQPFEWEDMQEAELEQRVIEINVRALLAGDPRYNIVVRDRDVINVPVDTGVYYLMGEVARPGVYAFGGRDITLKQALAASGGLGPFAWPRRCEIIRHEPGTDKQITIPVNLDAIFAGLQDDLYLRDDDIVNVGTHFIAPFLFVIRNSFRFTYGFGFVYDRNFADKDTYGSKMNPQVIEYQERSRRGLPF